jgi:hypothetical protein
MEIQGLQSRRQIAELLGVPLKELTYILYVQKPETFYRLFEIPKKNGGFRKIDAPEGPLIYIQRMLTRRLTAWILEKKLNPAFTI